MSGPKGRMTLSCMRYILGGNRLSMCMWVYIGSSASKSRFVSSGAAIF